MPLLHANTHPLTGKRRVFSAVLWLLCGMILMFIAACGQVSESTPPITPTQSEQGDFTYTLESGGTIVIKADAFPDGQPGNISIATSLAPTLPAGVKVLGETVNIDADNPELALPANIRLPLPDNIENADDIYIAAVDKTGAATILIPSFEGNEIIAMMPSLTSFAIVQIEHSNDAFHDSLLGKASLVANESSIYRVIRNFEAETTANTNALLKLTPSQEQEEWTVFGEVELIEVNGLTAQIKAKAVSENSSAIITVFFINPNDGLRYFAAAEIEIIQSSDRQEMFKANLLTMQPLLNSSEQTADFIAQVTDVAEPPITWSWEFGDGETGGPVNTDSLDHTLPSKSYKANTSEASNEYLVKLTATDSTGLTAETSFPVVVAYSAQQAQALEASIECPTRFDLRDPLCSQRLQSAQIDENYRAIVSGGEPPYQYFWQLSPGQSQFVAGTKTQLVSFTEPGDYQVKLLVEDQNQDQVEITQPVTIIGGSPLRITINGLPDTANPGDEVNMNLNFQGGVLIASGQRSSYDVRVNWEDGDLTTETLVLEDPLPDSPPDVARQLELSHVFQQNKVYYVRATVFDASGSKFTEIKSIGIGVINNGIGNINTDPNRNNTTGYIGLNYGNGQKPTAIEVISLKNFDDVMNKYPTEEDIASSDVKVFGDLGRPSISWTRLDAIKVQVMANCIGNCDSAIYGIQTVPNTFTNPDYIPFITSPLKYGRYDIPDTEVIPFQYSTFYNPSPDLVGQMTYTVTVFTQGGQQAILNFATQ